MCSSKAYVTRRQPISIIKISTDGFAAYRSAIWATLADRVDFAQLIIAINVGASAPLIIGVFTSQAPPIDPGKVD